MTLLSFWEWEGNCWLYLLLYFVTFLMHILNRTLQPNKWMTCFTISTADNSVCYFGTSWCVSLHDVYPNLMCILISTAANKVCYFWYLTWCVSLKQPFVIIATYGNILCVVFIIRLMIFCYTSVSKNLYFPPKTYTSLIPYPNIAYTSCQCSSQCSCHFHKTTEHKTRGLSTAQTNKTVFASFVLT